MALKSASASCRKPVSYSVIAGLSLSLALGGCNSAAEKTSNFFRGNEAVQTPAQIRTADARKQALAKAQQQAVNDTKIVEQPRQVALANGGKQFLPNPFRMLQRQTVAQPGVPG